MNHKEHGLEPDKIVQYLMGELEPVERAGIFEAAKADRALADRINETKAGLIAQGIAQCKTQDPIAFIGSGMLEAYIEGSLQDSARQVVELMVAAHPEIGMAYDAIKRKFVVAFVTRVQAIDPAELIASHRLTDYVLGEGKELERLEIELAAGHFPEVHQALEDLRMTQEWLVQLGAQQPPAQSKAKFVAFLESSEMPGDGWTMIMPPLSALSRPQDFAAWIDRIDAANIDAEINLNAVPLDVDSAMTTLFVVIKDRLDEETHVNVIERFLVVEGSCVVQVQDQEVHLHQGDYFAIPKFAAHTVIVTSSIPCKLIVQQVAA